MMMNGAGLASKTAPDRALRWQLYVATYTAALGMPLLLFPALVIPLLGFSAADDAWPRLTGLLLLSLSGISFSIWHRRAITMVMPSIVVRAFITAALLAMALAGYPPFLFIMTGIVALGVAGSTLAYAHVSGTT